ncbi:MAG: NAD(P)/FAD-dependent oxidoreductase, partial [Ignavibacteria bacterium]
MNTKNVIIIGGGFGGLTAAKILRRNRDIKLTIIDRTNHHLFQPLLYQVASAALSPGDIAVPIRAVFANSPNIKVIMDEVISIDKQKRKVITHGKEFEFDYLVVAVGSAHSYFGHDEWKNHAPGLKTLDDALLIREKILYSLETAENLENEKEAKKYLTYVIVGGGPTGVEMAGAISEILKKELVRDFRNINSESAKVYLIEGLPKLLSAYPDDLSENAKVTLQKMGVEVILKKMVTEVNENGIKMGDEFIESKNIIWAAGNTVSQLLQSLNTELDKIGRVLVNKDLSLKDAPEIFVIGDAALVKGKDGKLLPGIAPVAIQEGKYVAKIIIKENNSAPRKPFTYFDKGMMATIGRAKAVALIGGFKFTSFFAWLLWCGVHILFLIGFRNRFRVMAEWAWYYITFRHGI